MRKETEDSRLNVDNAFALNRVSNINNYETGFKKKSENDGNTWKVIEDINKKKRWVKSSV